MKFCRDCKWLIRIGATGLAGEHGVFYMKCVYGLEIAYDLVSGKPYFTGEPVAPNLERNNIGSNRVNHCGRDAQYYQRKWWKFWRPQ